MVQVTIKDSAGQAAGQADIPVPAELTANDFLVVARSIDRHQANARRPWAHTKTRAEVSGGGRKPWRQKGTGRARVGSTRSPLWRHGGVTWGPRNTRVWTKGLNKKERKRAIRVAFQAHVLQGTLTLVQPFSFEAPRTKDAVKLLEQLGLSGQKVLLVLEDIETGGDGVVAVWKSFRNLPHVTITEASRINAVLLAHTAHLVVTTAAWDTIRQLWFTQRAA